MLKKWAFITFLTVLFCACHSERNVVFIQFESVPQRWDNSEKVTFEVDSMREEGSYEMWINARTNRNYLYKQLIVEVRQEWNHQIFIDTVTCEISRDKGMSMFDGQKRFKMLKLYQGARGKITIYPVMACEIVENVMDVGVEMRKTER